MALKSAERMPPARATRTGARRQNPFGAFEGAVSQDCADCERLAELAGKLEREDEPD